MDFKRLCSRMSAKPLLLVCLMSAQILTVKSPSSQLLISAETDTVDSCRINNIPHDKIIVECEGEHIKEVPEFLPLNTTRLTFRGTGIQALRAVAFYDPNIGMTYNASLFLNYTKLEELVFLNNEDLSDIEPGAFTFKWNDEGMPDSQLRELRIKGSPKLTKIRDNVFTLFRKIKIVRITHCGLTAMPNFTAMSNVDELWLDTLDLSNNKIKRITPGIFSVPEGMEPMEIGKLDMDYNELEMIENHAFARSAIREVQVRWNPKLRNIQPHAFSSSYILESLNLEGTGLVKLPTNGLTYVRSLNLENTPQMHTFPSVLRMLGLLSVQLTYPYHCCAFAHPDKQYPAAWKAYLRQVEEECSTSGYVSIPMTSPMTTTQTTPMIPFQHRQKRYEHRSEPGWLKELLLKNYRQRESAVWYRYGRSKDLGFAAYSRNTLLNKGKLPGGRESLKLVLQKLRYGRPGISGRLVGDSKAPKNGPIDEIFRRKIKTTTDGIWHTSTLDPTATVFINVSCGPIEDLFRETKCTPEPDAFNPCEDIMGFVWLRIFVWFVVCAAILGNTVVLIVTLGSKYKLTVAKFLMCNLAFADLTLGVYLLLLAAFDLHTSGEYFNYAIRWQYEAGCQAAGFLAVFATCLSVFTLAVITIERWYAISYAIHLTKRLHFPQAVVVMVFGWIYAFIMAFLPIIGISGYYKTSTCLPMETRRPVDQAYVIVLLLVNAIGFMIICGCYIDMYCKVRGNDTNTSRNDASIAKRMAILVFTDFACLFPMALFGLTAAAGKPLITVTDSKILIVFFFPLNSCANPFLYAIFTRQFRKDLFGILARFGLCEKQAMKYKGTYTSNRMSLSHSRNSQGNNMVHRASDGSVLNTYLSESNRSSKASIGYVPTSRGSQDQTSHSNTCNSPSGNSVLSIQATLKENQSHIVIPDKNKDNRKLSIVPESSHITDEPESQTDELKHAENKEEPGDHQQCRSKHLLDTSFSESGAFDYENTNKRISVGSQLTNLSTNTESSFASCPNDDVLPETLKTEREINQNHTNSDLHLQNQNNGYVNMGNDTESIKIIEKQMEPSSTKTNCDEAQRNNEDHDVYETVILGEYRRFDRNTFSTV